MNIKTEFLISDLIKKTKINLSRVEQFRKYSSVNLNYRESVKKWSVLECIEHLNLYGDFYISEIEKSILKNETRSSLFFKSGIIGNYFVKSMLPKEHLNKMKTPKDKNPIGSRLDKKVIDRFIKQQKQILELIEKSKNINLNKTKVTISISKIIKLKLGDTFRFLIAHNQRHLKQAENVLNMKNSIE